MQKKITILCLGILLLSTFTIIFSVETAKADTIYVDDNGGEDYTSIQDAIDAANPGDTVFVYSGAYYENIIIDKNIFLEGEDRDTTVIDGGKNPGFDVVRITADYVNISGFTITNCTLSKPYDHYSGIALSSNYSTIENNIINSNEKYGISLNFASNNKIQNNTIKNNVYTGIDVNDASLNNIFSNNEVKSNSYGIYSTGSIAENIIKSNNISYNQNDGIVLRCNRTIINNNDIYRNGNCGVYLNGRIWSSSSFHEITNNNIFYNENESIYLKGDSNNTISDNSIYSDSEKTCIKLESDWKYYSKHNKISNNIIDTEGIGIEIGFYSNNYNIVDNNTITTTNNLSIKGLSYKNNIFDNNTLETGMEISGEDNIIKNNDLSSHGLNLFIDFHEYFLHGNTLNGKPIVYLKNKSNLLIDYPTGQIFLINCDNITIKNQDIHDVFFAIDLLESVDCIIDNNIFSNTKDYSITLHSDSKRNIISNNTFKDSWGGIWVRAFSNTIKFNTFKNHEGCGAYFSACCNFCYLNNFLENDNCDSMSGSPWINYNSTFSMNYNYNGEFYNSHLGNYWDHLSGVDSDNDGILDSRYKYDNINDSFPLKIPFSNYDIGNTSSVNEDPVARFDWNPLNPETDETVYFDASSSTDDNSIVSYEWDFDNDGNYDNNNGEKVTWSWENEGEFEVSLRVMDDEGVYDTLTKTITIEEENNAPEANADGPYYGYINSEIDFDASKSEDSDGTIVSWIWDLGDGTSDSGETTTHTYSSSNNFTVTLTVTDNDGETDVYTTYAVITGKPNTPPSIPTISGPTKGKQDTEYKFNFKSSDSDKDPLCFNISWGDEKTNSTIFYPQNTNVTKNHSWDKPGEYKITAKAYDNNTESKEKTFTILIDVLPVDDQIKGYFIDLDSDGIYDKFHEQQNNSETSVEKLSNDLYLIDTNSDGLWDYKYNTTLESLSKYDSSSDDSENEDKSNENNKKQNTSSSKSSPEKSVVISNLINNPISLIILAVFIIAVVTSFLFLKNRNKDQKIYEKPKGTKNSQNDDQKEIEKFDKQPFKKAGIIDNAAVASDNNPKTTSENQMDDKPKTKKTVGSKTYDLNFCPGCGSKIKNNDQTFCVNCGEKLKK